MDGPQAELPAVAGLPEQRPPGEPASADVLRSFGLDALVELVEGCPQALGVTGEDRRWVYLNPAGCRLLGRSFDEVRGSVPRDEVEIVPAGPPLRVAGEACAPALVHAPGSPAVTPAEEASRRQAARTAAEQERHRLGRELHDSVSSALFALHTRAEVVERALAGGDAALLAEAVKDMRALSGQAIAELRAVVRAMREAAPAERVDAVQDLPAALERLATTARRRDGLAVDLQLARPLPAVPPVTAGHLARIAAEAVHNSVKHAGASRVRVALEVRGSEVVLTVLDGGRGFDPSAVPDDRHGQRTMRERAVLCGGSLEVDTGVGRGTRVVARVPLTG